ncbi:armadillo-type protein, partial [Mycena pura]
ASSRSHNSSDSRARLRTIEPIGEEQSYPDGPQSPPFLAPRGYSPALTDPEPPYLRHMQSTSTFPSNSSVASPKTYTESVLSQPSSVGTAPNANLLAGALLTEIQKLGLRSQKDAQKLVTAGTIPTLILLLKTRAVDGIRLEAVLLTLGILTHDPITANTISRTNTTTTLIAIVDAAQSDNIMALAVWCLARIARSTEVASGLLKHNLGKLLATKGLKGGRDTARISGWCIGILIRSDSIAEALAEAGFAAVLAEHLRRCAASIDAGAEDYSAALYAVARFSRSIKIAKVLTRGGTVEVIAHLLLTTEDPRVLEWAARAVGCLMRPNSGDMAKALLDAGIARGLARLPSMLPAEDITPLGAFAFAVQRFSCAEWGGGTRKALVDAGVVDSLLAALRSAADEPYPQVHIELAYAIALLADVGGTAIRKEIVNAGGIDILKHIAGMGTARADVGKACNLAVTSVTGNVWSRNAASAKAALAHEWSGGCPDYVPECPVRLTDLDADSW